MPPVVLAPLSVRLEHALIAQPLASPPSSLAEGGMHAPVAGSRGLLKWPRALGSTVFELLTGYLRRGSDDEADEDSTSDAATSRRASRRVSRADEGSSGVRLAPEIGLAVEFGAQATKDDEVRRQALLNATEQVVGSVRPLIRRWAASQPSTVNSPRIVILGSHAQVRAHYLAHSCEIGAVSGSKPEACVQELFAYDPTCEREPTLRLRDDVECVFYSDDVDELLLLPDSSVDVLLVFDVQLNPTHVVSARWTNKLASVLREGGSVAGLVGLEPTPSVSAFSPPPSSFSPIPPTHCHSSSSLAALRSFRDRLESRSLFVHSAVDLSLEGALVLLDAAAGEQQESLLFARLLATKQCSAGTCTHGMTPLNCARALPPPPKPLLTARVASPTLSPAPSLSCSLSSTSTLSPSPSPTASASVSTLDARSRSATPYAALSLTRTLSSSSLFELGSTAGSSRSSPALTACTPHVLPVAAPSIGAANVQDERMIVVSGLSMGLPQRNEGPNADAPLFSRLHIDALFDGCDVGEAFVEVEEADAPLPSKREPLTFIQPLSGEDKSAMRAMNASQVTKDKTTGKRISVPLQADEQLVQVCSKLPPRREWKLADRFHLPKHVVEVLDATYELAVCAGLEALRDAGFDIKLNGSSPDEIGLPEHMRDETGVIFASSFPAMESLVKEVSAKVRAETAREVAALLGAAPPAGFDYAYDRKLLFKLLCMANCQLAELIRARGPNIHLNTACSGTSQAIATAEDWIKAGRCKRVIVLSADVATSEECLPYLATGFLALGAASVLHPARHAAAPFDARRRGMILGSGSVAMVLETAAACAARGHTPKAELVGSHEGNSAFHASLMDSVSISAQLQTFLRRIETERGINLTSGDGARAFAKELVYFSHETSTHASGGCARTELAALASVFSDDRDLADARHSILLANSKGFHAHPMAVGFEDALAVESLQRAQLPPVPNFHKLDPRLDEFVRPNQISRGGRHARQYVLRMAGGFGSQFCYTLYKRIDPTAWQARLQQTQLLSQPAQTLVRASVPFPCPLQLSAIPNTPSLTPAFTPFPTASPLAAHDTHVLSHQLSQ